MINLSAMKKSITAFLFCVIATVATAQPETQSFYADGIKVIFKPTTKKVINVRIYFRGGVTNYPPNQAGIENLTLDAATKCGTKKYPVGAFKDTSDKYGILIYGRSAYDYGFIEVNCISEYFNKGWDLFAESVNNPTFEDNELKLLKDKKISSWRSYEADPYNRLDELQMQNAFKNTPYATNPLGAEEVLRGFSSDDLRNYHKTLLNKNKIFIVVVGNIDRQELFEKILLAFGNIPSRPYAAVDVPSPAFNSGSVATEGRNLKINYIGAIMNCPNIISPEYVPFRMGISGLSGNIYHYLRSELNVSYNAGAFTNQLKTPYVTMFATSNDISGAMGGMVKKLKNIQSEGLNDEWLQHIKNTYLTSSFINEQSASAITAGLGQAEVLGGWQYAEHLTKLVQMVTVEQVNNALNFYIGGLRWTVLGNPGAIEGITAPAN